MGGCLTFLLWSSWGFFALIWLAPGLFSLNFFRDPARSIPSGPGEIVSPADGKVVEVAPHDESPYFDGPCLRVSIFLNIFDVHVNRIPEASTVLRTERQEGAYHNAMNPDSSTHNVALTLWLETEHGPLTIRQITGAVARRIVCRAEPGDSYARGEKFGMIKFGSRAELYLPPDAQTVVQVGDKVKGGSSILARLT